MTGGWSIWVIAIVAINIVGSAWLLWWTAKRRPGDPPADATSHHWDGDLTEYNKPLPMWWINLFWLTIVFSIAYLIWWIPAHADLHGLWNSGGQGGSFFAGMDLVIALSVSWIPLVADYTRFSTGRRVAFWGAGLGYLFPTLFQFGFGAILVLSHSISGPVDVITTIAAGSVASFFALFALTVDETDEAFANIYSTAMSLQNFVPQAPSR